MGYTNFTSLKVGCWEWGHSTLGAGRVRQCGPVERPGSLVPGDYVLTPGQTTSII